MTDRVTDAHLARTDSTIQKTCDYKVSDSSGSGWERPCFGIHRCMDRVSEVCQWASPLLAGERRETVWGSDPVVHVAAPKW